MTIARCSVAHARYVVKVYVRVFSPQAFATPAMAYRRPVLVDPEAMLAFALPARVGPGWVCIARLWRDHQDLLRKRASAITWLRNGRFWPGFVPGWR